MAPRHSFPAPGWGRADLHVHTCFSDGWPTPWEVVEQGCRLGLDVVAVTDHDTIEGALRAVEFAAAHSGRLQLVVGEEVSSRDGHIVGLFLTRRVRPGMSAAATVDAIHEQGGLAVAVHPFWRTDRQSRGGRVHGVGWSAAELDFDAVEVENATPGLYLFNQMAHRLNEAIGRAELGGSDAHILDALGCARTDFPGTTPEALRRAILARRTRAEREPYTALALLRYAAWGIERRQRRQRRRTPATEGAARSR